MKIEYKRDVWDEEQQKLVNPLVVSTGSGKGDKYCAVDIRPLSKYQTVRAVIEALAAVERSK